MNADLTSINGLSKLNVNIVETYFEALLFLINNFFFQILMPFVVCLCCYGRNLQTHLYVLRPGNRFQMFRRAVVITLGTSEVLRTST